MRVLPARLWERHPPSTAESVAVPPPAITGHHRPSAEPPDPHDRQQMLADGRPLALVEALLASADSRARSGLITTTVEEITGAPARTFRSWAEEHAEEFR
ncbi:hypothetical protein [Streptomyces sp. NPDC053560]|uniref:hypothetical protein n=1 Tax=Streptomyces sp. NPDC053560 TaxID=3365711 RepID=UPI0037D406B6